MDSRAQENIQECVATPLTDVVWIKGENGYEWTEVISNKVIIIMDAGFHCEWFKLIESLGCFWICLVRQGKSLQLSNSDSWLSIK